MEQRDRFYLFSIESDILSRNSNGNSLNSLKENKRKPKAANSSLLSNSQVQAGIVEVVSLGRDVSIEDPEISRLRVNTRSRLSTRSSRALYRATRKGEPAADREIILAHTISARFYPALERLIQRYTIPFSLNLRSVVIVRRASKRALFGFYFE